MKRPEWLEERAKYYGNNSYSFTGRERGNILLLLAHIDELRAALAKLYSKALPEKHNIGSFGFMEPDEYELRPQEGLGEALIMAYDIYNRETPPEVNHETS